MKFAMELIRSTSCANEVYKLTKIMKLLFIVQKELLSHPFPKALRLRLVNLYGCKKCTFSLGEQNKLQVLENKGLRKIYGSTRDEVSGEWSIFYQGLCDLYRTTSIITVVKSRTLKCVAHVAWGGGEIKLLVGKPLEKMATQKTDDDITMGLRQVSCM
jgi:hypothetical protein